MDNVPRVVHQSAGFGHHLDRTAWTFGYADAATLAIVEIEFEPLARSQFDHRVVGAHAVAVVAFEAIAARHAAARFEQRAGFGQAAHDLFEGGRPAGELEQRTHRLGRIAEIP